MKDLPRFFSLEEANALLPDLEIRIGRLIEKKESYAQRHDQLLMMELLAEAEHRAGKQGNMQSLESEIHALEATLAELEKDLKGFRKLGCILRNIDKGWVDFPGRWNSEYVYFCWRRGEPEILFYHPTKGKSTDRRPLNETSAKGRN